MLIYVRDYTRGKYILYCPGRSESQRNGLVWAENSLSNLDRIRSEVKAGQKRILSRPC